MRYKYSEKNTTKYGEFVSSYFAWVPLPDQKERAKELDKITLELIGLYNKTNN